MLPGAYKTKGPCHLTLYEVLTEILRNLKFQFESDIWGYKKTTFGDFLENFLFNP